MARIGSWLMRAALCDQGVNGEAHMHGGIASVSAQDSLASLNGKLQGELMDFLTSMDELRAAGVMPWYVDYHDRLNFLTARVEEFAAANPRKKANWFPAVNTGVRSPEGVPVQRRQSQLVSWYSSSRNPYSESFNTERFLKQVGARQVVMGHTPTRGEVLERMDGMAIRLDTGMLTSDIRGGIGPCFR